MSLLIRSAIATIIRVLPPIRDQIAQDSLKFWVCNFSKPLVNLVMSFLHGHCSVAHSSPTPTHHYVSCLNTPLLTAATLFLAQCYSCLFPLIGIPQFVRPPSCSLTSSLNSLSPHMISHLSEARVILGFPTLPLLLNFF